jgi:tryptophanyl-tRNA synthetase
MRIFSGIRPTGQLHLGNYLGAISQWLKLQEENECFFCIVDLHAITTPYVPSQLRENILELAIEYLSLGLDPKKSIIFVQSRVKEHAELAWILGTITPLGDLKRMTQFKEKSKKYKGKIFAGLLNYPLLMAADILLYQTDLVPVGEDQKQHLELTREIAKKFNKMYGKVFKVPSILLPASGKKIMSLTEPTKKMSKTDDENSCIFIFEPPEKIREKIKKAITDSGKEIKYDPKQKPGISNLMNIFSLISGKSIKEIEEEFKGKGYSFFKERLADLLIEKFEPFRKKRGEFLRDKKRVEKILEEGAKKASKIAKDTMQKVKEKIGLI